jgi:hypothetical protein
VRRDEHLLPVRDGRRKVDAAPLGAAREPACLPDRVRNARTPREMHEPRPPHCADDVDDQRPSTRGRRGSPRRTRLKRGNAERRPAGCGGVPPHEHDRHHCEQRDREQAPTVHAELNRRHAATVAEQPSRVGNAFVQKVELLRC